MAGLIRRKPRVVPVPATAPVDPDLQQIDEWEAWFRSGHEELLREWPNTSDADKQQIAQRRAQVDRLATAITAERRAAYLARKATP